MVLFEWNEQYSVKIPSIDRQHKVLIGYINELHDASQKKGGKTKVGMILSKLAGYTKSHFLYEEMLFGTYNYQDEPGHKMRHEKFINKIQDFNTQFKSGEDVSIELLNFLKNWLVDHIQKEDMAYADYMISKGVT